MSYGKIVRQVGVVTTIPMLFAAGPLVGYFMGQWIDTRFHTDPWGKTVLALLGFIASIKQSITIIKAFIKESEQQDSQDGTD